MLSSKWWRGRNTRIWSRFPFPTFLLPQSPHLQIPAFIVLGAEKLKNQHSEVIFFFNLQQRKWSKGQDLMVTSMLPSHGDLHFLHCDIWPPSMLARYHQAWGNSRLTMEAQRKPHSWEIHNNINECCSSLHWLNNSASLTLRVRDDGRRCQSEIRIKDGVGMDGPHLSAHNHCAVQNSSLTNMWGGERRLIGLHSYDLGVLWTFPKIPQGLLICESTMVKGSSRNSD